jgi:hypothetical protein
VAPVTTKGATERTVAVPAGRWHGDDGTVIEGPTTVRVHCDLARIPRFERSPSHDGPFERGTAGARHASNERPSTGRSQGARSHPVHRRVIN